MNLWEMKKANKIENSIDEVFDVEVMSLIDQDFWLRGDIDLNYFKDESKCFILSIDTADGDGGNNNVMNVFELELFSLQEIQDAKMYFDEYSFTKMVQVGYLLTNKITLEHFAGFIFHFISNYMIADNIKIMLEINHEGKYVKHLILNTQSHDLFDETIFFSFVQKNKKRTIGLKTHHSNKEEASLQINDMIKNHRIVIFDKETVSQIQSMVRPKNGKGFMVTTGYDDIAMTVLLLTHVVKCEEFQELCEFLYDRHQDIYKAVSEKLDNVSYMDDEDDDLYDDPYDMFEDDD